MGLRAYVTGGSGFVGMNLMQQLAEAGWSIRALVRDTSPLEDIENLGAELVEGDVTDADSVLATMPDEPDAVFHVAASTSIWSGNNEQQRRINVEGTRNVVNAAMARNAGRLIHTSSFIVWGFQPKQFNEKTPRVENADWINYVRTKHEAETIVRSAVEEGLLDAVILNPAHILGPGDRHNWSRAFRMIYQGRLPGVPPGAGSFADVREVARAHVRAFHDGRSGHNYLLGGNDTPFLEVVRVAGGILGRKVPGRASPALLLQIAGRVYGLIAAMTRREPLMTPEGAAMVVRHLYCDSTKAVDELGYRFTPTSRLVADTIDWMRNKGMLG